MLTSDVLLTVIVSCGCGIGVGWWRCMVYARRLIHFHVSLDEWADYDEHTTQAPGARRREQGRLNYLRKTGE